MTKQYKYFIYSESEYNENKEILSKAGKEFKLGTVVVNGARKNFTSISNSPTIGRYYDCKVIAEGYLDSFIYTMPAIVKKGKTI